jgi:hypothetical protein
VVAGATVVASLAVSSSSPQAANVRAAAAAVARIILVFIILLRGGWFTLDRIPLEHSRAPPDNGARPLLDGDAGTRCRVIASRVVVASDARRMLRSFGTEADIAG